MLSSFQNFSEKTKISEPLIRTRSGLSSPSSATRPRPGWSGPPESWSGRSGAAGGYRSAAQPGSLGAARATDLPSPSREKQGLFIAHRSTATSIARLEQEKVVMALPGPWSYPLHNAITLLYGFCPKSGLSRFFKLKETMGVEKYM